MRALEEHRYFGFTKIERKNILQKKKKIKILPPTGYRGEASCYVLLLLQTKLFRWGEGGGVNREGICYKLGRIKWDLVQRAAI